MSNHERTKVYAFSAIVALVGLLIVIIGTHTLFSELLFYGMVVVLIGLIVVLVAYTFLWQRTVRYIRTKIRKRKHDSLAREYFDDFRDFVERFTSLGEFRGSKGITGILDDLLKKAPSERGLLIDARIKNFNPILHNPMNDFKQKVNNLYWHMKDLNHEFLSCLAREFENYVRLHKHLYVDFAAAMARELGLEKIAQATKRSYSDYKDDYNQFIIAYTEFAKRSTKVRLGIFSEHLQKANEL